MTLETLVVIVGFIGLIAFAVLYVAVSPDAGKADLKTKFLLALILLLGGAMLTNTVIAGEALHTIDTLRR